MKEGVTKFVRDRSTEALTPSPARRKLLFVSPRFLFPVDSGGKIRTTQILRGMRHSGAFEITLASPARPADTARYQDEIATVCHRFVSWPDHTASRAHRVFRLRNVFSSLPISVASDRSAVGREVVASELATDTDVVVFDFAHAAVLAPRRLSMPAALFTHNVESEIFARHAQVSTHVMARMLWWDQHRKMERFERMILERFNTIIAVSERDREVFERQRGGRGVSVIPTGVDLEFFPYSYPQPKGEVIFTGSMDWLANIDGVGWLLEEVWPHIARTLPDVNMKVVGRAPPKSLRSKAAKSGFRWTFTGFVEDVRPHVYCASVFVIPLRVGGGTRLKVFEAMAMGIPIVSTGLGVEGLSLIEGKHFLRADTAQEFARAIERLTHEPRLAKQLSLAARELVEREYSYENAACEFERICLRMAARQSNDHRADMDTECSPEIVPASVESDQVHHRNNKAR